MCGFLLLSFVWTASFRTVSPRPISPFALFCQNTERQIENIYNLLRTIGNKTKGVVTVEAKQKRNFTVNEDQMCDFAKRLTSYQTCDLDLTEDIKKIMNHTKIETKGLVDNMQMNSDMVNCDLSRAACPVSNLSMWKKIDFLLNSWSRDVLAYSNSLPKECSFEKTDISQSL